MLAIDQIVQAVVVFTGAYTLYGILLVIYRLYFSPLAKFPGPKLTAAMLWYEFYFDVVKRGKFAWEIARMHEIYGPVVRINPHELHVNDPDFYDVLYGGKRDKYKWSTDMMEVRGAMFTTVEHDLHRKRRAPLAPFFSASAIRRFDHVIRDKLDILSRRFDEYREGGRVVDLDNAMTAMTTDVITQYCFGASNGFLQEDEFQPQWRAILRTVMESGPLNKQMHWLMSTVTKIPVAWLVWLKPEMANYINFRVSIEEGLRKVMSPTKLKADAENPTIFESILSSDLPASDKTSERLVAEAESVVGAGALTVAHYLTTTIYHILANPTILQKLQEEMKMAIPDPNTLPSIHELNQLTYFSAVVLEGFRISHGVTSRLTRIAPNESLQVAGFTIPAGTPVNMSSFLSHLHPELFPQPHVFRPERWLEPGAEDLKKYLVNFSRGSRACLGKELAKAEIVYTLALVVARWRMELFETDRSDVDIVHDFFAPFARLDSKGVRVLMK